eukprot:jgi/Mesvir1/18611/Mv17120-RA.1
MVRASIATDIATIVNPEVTFWKTVYPRHTNFAWDDTLITQSTGTADYGQLVEFKLPRSGDIVTKCTLDVPGLRSLIRSLYLGGIYGNEMSQINVEKGDLSIVNYVIDNATYTDKLTNLAVNSTSHEISFQLAAGGVIDTATAGVTFRIPHTLVADVDKYTLDATTAVTTVTNLRDTEDEKYHYFELVNASHAGRVRVQKGTHLVNGQDFCDVLSMGKRKIKTFTRTQAFEGLVDALKAHFNLQTDQLIERVQGGTPTLQGTWMHTSLVWHVAAWISPVFAVAAMDWAEVFYSTPECDKGCIDTLAQRVVQDVEMQPSHRAEADIRDRIAELTKGHTEFPVGSTNMRADIVSYKCNMLLEVKEVARWTHAVGQLLVYGQYFPTLTKVMVVFDKDGLDITDEQIDQIDFHLQGLNIMVCSDSVKFAMDDGSASGVAETDIGVLTSGVWTLNDMDVTDSPFFTKAPLTTLRLNIGTGVPTVTTSAITWSAGSTGPTSLPGTLSFSNVTTTTYRLNCNLGDVYSAVLNSASNPINLRTVPSISITITIPANAFKIGATTITKSIVIPLTLQFTSQQFKYHYTYKDANGMLLGPEPSYLTNPFYLVMYTNYPSTIDGTKTNIPAVNYGGTGYDTNSERKATVLKVFELQPNEQFLVTRIYNGTVKTFSGKDMFWLRTYSWPDGPTSDTSGLTLPTGGLSKGQAFVTAWTTSLAYGAASGTNQVLTGFTVQWEDRDGIGRKATISLSQIPAAINATSTTAPSTAVTHPRADTVVKIEQVAQNFVRGVESVTKAVQKDARNQMAAEKAMAEKLMDEAKAAQANVAKEWGEVNQSKVDLAQAWVDVHAAEEAVKKERRELEEDLAVYHMDRANLNADMLRVAVDINNLDDDRNRMNALVADTKTVLDAVVKAQGSIDDLMTAFKNAGSEAEAARKLEMSKVDQDTTVKLAQVNAAMQVSIHRIHSVTPYALPFVDNVGMGGVNFDLPPLVPEKRKKMD